MISDVVSDLFYIAAIVNYALQCQLITYLINVTVERVYRNRWIVDDAIKVCDVIITVSNINVIKYEIMTHVHINLARFLDIEVCGYCIIAQLIIENPI